MRVEKLERLGLTDVEFGQSAEGNNQLASLGWKIHGPPLQDSIVGFFGLITGNRL